MQLLQEGRMQVCLPTQQKLNLTTFQVSWEKKQRRAHPTAQSDGCWIQKGHNRGNKRSAHQKYLKKTQNTTNI